MAAPKAPLLDSAGKKSKELTLEASVFGAELKPHVVHETVRAELNADRAGTRAAKSRGLVRGGRAKPWRQKGTGRARAGTTRAPHWTGGSVAFPPTPRDFEVKVNRKARRSALRGVLSQHAADGTFGVLDGAIILADEVLTPDSSRFWPADDYEPGKGQDSYDKQFVRDYLERIGWKKEPPVPALPEDVVAGTREKYLEIFRRLTGKRDGFSGTVAARPGDDRSTAARGAFDQPE